MGNQASEVKDALESVGLAPEPVTEDSKKMLRDVWVEMGEDPLVVDRLKPDAVGVASKLIAPLSGIAHNVAPANRPQATATAMASFFTKSFAPGHELFQAVPALVLSIVNARPYVFNGDRSCFERSSALAHDSEVAELLDDLADYVASGGEVIPEQFNDILVAKHANKDKVIELFVMTLLKENLPLEVKRFLQPCAKAFLLPAVIDFLCV